MKDWDEDKQELIDNIKQELNLLSSETEKVFVLTEVFRTLDTDKMPPSLRDSLKSV